MTNLSFSGNVAALYISSAAVLTSFGVTGALQGKEAVLFSAPLK